MDNRFYFIFFFFERISTRKKLRLSVSDSNANNMAELNKGQEKKKNLGSLPVQRVDLQTSDLLVMWCHTNKFNI